MEHFKLTKQLFEFQKSSLNNSLQAMAAFKSPMLYMSQIMFEAGKKIPMENQKIMDEWMQAFKNSQEEMQKTVDDGYEMIGTFLSTPSAKV